MLKNEQYTAKASPTVQDNLVTEPMHSDSADPIVQREAPAVTLSGIVFNYFVIAALFLMIGLVLGSQFFAAPAAPALTQEDVARIVNEALANADFSAGGPDNSRFELVDNDPFLGPEDAPVVIVEFSDFRCPYCGRHYAETLEPLLENYGQYIRYVYRDFAVLGPESVQASLAARCANEQERFWDFHDAFFSNQGLLSRDFYLATARQFELNIDQFTECLDTAKYQNDLNADLFDGQLNGVSGTPGFFVNGTFIRGAQPYEIFERAVQRELSRAGIDYTASAESS